MQKEKRKGEKKVEYVEKDKEITKEKPRLLYSNSNNSLFFSSMLHNLSD